MEIHRLYQQLSVINNDVSENDKIDIAIIIIIETSLVLGIKSLVNEAIKHHKSEGT